MASDLDPSALWCLVLLLFSFLLGGIKIGVVNWYITRIRLRWYDFIRLPLAMSFFGYVFPLKGGALMQIYWLRKEYEVSVSSGLTNVLLNQLIPITLAGLIVLSFATSLESKIFSITAILLAPLLVMVTFILHFVIDQRWSESKIGHHVSKFYTLIRSTFANTKLLLAVLLLSVAKLIFESFWFLIASQQLDIEITMEALFALVLIRTATVLVKVTPGNIGVNEFIGGQFMSMIGSEFVDGFVLMLFLRLCSVLLSFTFGYYFFTNVLGRETVKDILD